MAGIKITDLTALATAEAADYLCIVDVSDTTSSPEGTTKKITVANTGASLGIESGLFTSAITSASGFDTISAEQGVFIRIGDIVNYGFIVNFQLAPTGSGADQLGDFIINFPQKVNNFSSEDHSFQLTVTENNPNTFNKTIVHNGDLTATININSIGTGGTATSGKIYVTAIYTL
jgi:hypothetical protein